MTISIDTFPKKSDPQTPASVAPITYSQMGSVIDVELVTVPAGTFSAIKLQSTLTWTDTLGTTRTQTVTNWRDVATSIWVKEEISYAYSGGDIE
jgi:carbohydrate-binding DOMON domain-containing protein